MMDNDNGIQKSTKLIIITIALMMLGVIVFGIVSSLQKKGKIAVDFEVAPRQATVTVNGKKTGKKAQLPPGTYVVIVSQNGFESITRNIDLKLGDPKLVFTAALTPKSADAKDIAADQSGVYANVEEISGGQVREEGEDFFNDNPLLRNIPVRTSYYSIDYGKDASGGVVVQITANQPLGRQVALEKIRSWGFDPTDYKIVFIGLDNPFPRAVN